MADDIDSEVFEFDCQGHSIRLFLPDVKDHIQSIIRDSSDFYESALLRDIQCRLSNKGLIVDVGACIGNHTVFFAAVMRNPVLAIEPNQEAFQILERNIEENSIQDLVKALPVAAGSTVSRGRSIVRDDDNLGSAYFELTDSGNVDCVPLDQSLRDVDEVSLIKIDVENAELDVLEGASQTIQDHQPILCIESATHESRVRVATFLSHLGYVPVACHNFTPTYLYLHCHELDDASRLLFDRLENDAEDRKQEHLRTLREVRRFRGALSRWVGGMDGRKSEHLRATKELQGLRETFDQKKWRFLDELADEWSETKHELSILKNRVESLTETIATIEREKRELTEKNSKANSALRKMATETATLRHELNEKLERTENDLHRVRMSFSYQIGNRLVVAVRKPIPHLLVLPFSVGGLIWSKLRNRFRNVNRPLITLRRRADSIRYRLRQSRRRLAKNPLVTIVMPAFNSADTIVKALRSLLAQDYANIEILVVDDSSDDNTPELVAGVAKFDDRVHIIRMHRNMGPYWAKNFATSYARGEFITFHDADDWSHPHRISKQVEAFSQEQSRRLVTVSFNRIDPEGKVVLNRGKEKRLCLATMMFMTEDFVNIFGSFDAVRFGADYELYCRAKKLFERDAIYNVADVMYFALSVPSSLSSRHEVRLNVQDDANEGTFLSSERKQYVEQFESWQSANREDLRIPFPLTRRRFEVDRHMNCLQGDLANRSVVATIASIPSRQESLRQVIERISPQVDAIGVYLNNYTEVPNFLSDSKVTVIRSQDCGDFADNAKFFFDELIQDAIHLTIDDDIDYPVNYVGYLLTKLVQYDCRAVVGVHGVIFDPEFTKFLRNRYVYHFAELQNFDRLVNLLGTGTIMYDTRTITFSHKNAESTGMIDIWFARHAKLSKVPMIAVRRPQHYLKQIEQDSSDNLMGLARANDERHTKIVASAGSWHPRNYMTELVENKLLVNCFDKDLFE